MIVPVLLFLVGLLFLIKGGDWFVDGATGIAHRFGVPEILIGATVVSIGTTLPEVLVSATSAFGGHGEIAYGNAVGSIICNTALIAALTITVRPSRVDKNTFKTPVLFFFFAAVLYTLIAYLTGSFSRFAGMLLLGIFIVYLVYTIFQAKKMLYLFPEAETETKQKRSVVRDVLLLIFGAFLIAFGANLLVDNGTLIAEGVGVPESVIALTFVALGTSLPELVTAITSLAKGHASLSLGNIIGANFFNLVLVSGVSAVLSPFSLPQNKMIAGVNASLVLDLPVMLITMALLTLPSLIRGKLSRVQGGILLVVYGLFCLIQFAV